MEGDRSCRTGLVNETLQAGGSALLDTLQFYLLARVTAGLPVVDLQLEEPPIDEIVRRIYLADMPSAESRAPSS
jgi:hypothetical protein